VIFGAVVFTILGLLFGLPWWTLLFAQADWPAAVRVGGSVFFGVWLASFPVLMYVGHGSRRLDWAARLGDTTLGIIWVLFTWALIGNVFRLGLDLAGVADPLRSRVVAIGVLAVALVLCLWGYAEAMRVPRVRRVEVTIPRLGEGFDGTKVVILTDTHYGPINRARWMARVAEAVNALEPDIVCHTGDIADGSVAQRREQAAPLAAIRARLARTYVTGNHEYFGQAQAWVDHMRELGWEAMENRHLVLSNRGDQLVVAGVDDATASSSDLKKALSGVDPELPVLLLAHQPKQVGHAVASGVDIQISGHTHGGQIWPFHLLVKLDQPALQGLTRHGERTQLYTSRGAGFWGPPLRIFAPSEISLLILRRPIN
jgi:predicted MPP superfamily phosphohydrolase